MSATSFPLQWPPGWPRTPQHRQGKSRFVATYDRAMKKLRDEVRLLGAKSLVVSSDVPVRQDGQPYADAARRKIDNPGVAIYFQLDGKPMVMARDSYWTVHENIMALAHTIEHMRGLERHGGSYTMQQAFSGFAALPSPAGSRKRSWWEVLGVKYDASAADIAMAFKVAAFKAHPDRGGSEAAMAEINQARDEALKAQRTTQ